MKQQILLFSLCVLSASSLMADEAVLMADASVETTDMPMEEKSESRPLCEHNDRTQRITFKHREANGIGYPTGYSSVEGFFSTSKTPNLVGFADVRAHVFNDSRKAYNLGVGVRGLSEPLHLVFGANVFYDYRDGRHRAFNQIGVGLEVLGTRWDLRASGYIPVHNTKKKYRDEFLKFKGSSAVFAKRYEFAFIGAEIALGRELVRSKYWDLHAKLAGYWFNGAYGKNAGGGLFELATNITRYLTLKGQASYDSLFRGIFQAEAAINIPFGARFESRESELCCSVLKMLEDRLVETVDRFEMIVTSTKRKKAVAIDPMTGDPLTFIFVDNTSHSLGTFESPFPTLLQAQNASAPDDVIYVFPGDGTTNGMNAGITLQNNQKLIGSGVPVTVTTPFGLRTIPAQTTATPLISNTGNVVTLANNNEVSGFGITSSGGRGIIGGGASTLGAVITSNSIVTSNNAIDLAVFSGNVIIRNNLLSALGSNNAAVALGGSNSFHLAIINNSLFANTGNTITLFVNQGATGTANISFNRINDLDPPPGPPPIAMAATGLDIVVGVGGSIPASLTGSISNNTFMNPSIDGINLGTTTAGTFNMLVSKNVITTPGANGIGLNIGNTIASTSNFNIVDNVIINANASDGIAILTNTNGSATARVAGNTSSSVNTFGYLFVQSGTNTLAIETPDMVNPQLGLQAINIGTFDPQTFTDGVTFIPFVP